ncbi:hypothetical protein [Halorubrum halophilum]|uniref:hypothetical protein n=1 Tax=Halorubrum halophilum TaxID=413816 RepID=UPI000A468704|nr:hypothetical protein [Halorubrum halophilum]
MISPTSEKRFVDVAGQPLPTYPTTTVDAESDDLVVVGYEAAQIVDRFDAAFEGVPITYVHQRERLGIGHAMLQAEPHVDGIFLPANGDRVLRGCSACGRGYDRFRCCPRG